MNEDRSGMSEHVREIADGQNAIVLALVVALHDSGVLRRDSYCDALQRLWAEMPDEAAIGEAGAVIDRMLEALAATALPSDLSDGPESLHELSGFAETGLARTGTDSV